MKPFFAAATLALGLCSCSESATVVQILQTIQPSDTCAFTATDPGIASGSLNLQFRSSYLVGLVVRSAYTNTPIDVNGVPLEPGGDVGGSATAFVDTLKLSYASTPSVSIPDQEVPYAAALNPGSDENLLLANLMTTEAAQALATATAGGTNVQVLVTAKLSGKYASGKKSFESNELVYGINVSQRAVAIPACAAGTAPTPVAPCGSLGGQDGQYPTCL